jgi:hypothetical protein
MRIDTKIILIHCIVTAILTRTRFLVMAALILILRGLPKDESGISQILKKHTSEVWKQKKKNFVWPQLQGCPKILKILN